MELVTPHLSRTMLVGLLLALQPVVASLMVTAAGAEQYSSQRWFAQAVEPLPLPQMPAQSKASLPPACLPAPQDLPLSQLTADIRPRDREAQVVSADGLPEDCAAHVFTDQRFLSVKLDCESCRPKWCDVLRLANFCHRPLYFEEECLERCGCKTCCCQPAASALHFYGTALFMPVTAMCVCPCSCVPAEYCCPPNCYR